jgi:GMP synthase (glutamine-hydrolysing)
VRATGPPDGADSNTCPTGTAQERPAYPSPMPILVLQHDPACTPGRLGLTLRDHAQKLDIRRLDLPESRTNPHVPKDFENIDGVIALGGPQNVGESHSWMNAEIDFLRETHNRQIPLVGVCLGSQLISVALGGKVAPMSKPEWGFPVISQLPIANTDVILAGIPWRTRQFAAHTQHVTDLPPGATLLQSSEACKVQSYRIGLRTYAFQYHFECDRAMVDAFAQGSANEIGACGLTPESFKSEVDEHYPRSAVVADRLSVNISSFLFPMKQRVYA